MKPVFIGGCHRSGTTLAGARVLEHQDGSGLSYDHVGATRGSELPGGFYVNRFSAVIGNQGTGTVGTKVGGTDESGKPYNMVLMRKRKDWFDADQKEKQKPLDEMDRAIREGRPHSGTELKGSDVYTPDGGNKIG